MNHLSNLDLQLSEIQTALSEPSITPAVAVEMRLAHLLSDIDDIAHLAAQPETVGLVAAQEVTVGRMLTRVQLIASLLEARRPAGLRLVTRR